MLLKKKYKETVTQVNRDKSPPSVWGDILYLVSKLLMVGLYWPHFTFLSLDY